MEILRGPYSRSSVVAMVDNLGLPIVEITGKLVLRRFKGGQPVPVINAIPQLVKIREAIQAIDAKHNHDL